MQGGFVNTSCRRLNLPTTTIVCTSLHRIKVRLVYANSFLFFSSVSKRINQNIRLAVYARTYPKNVDDQTTGWRRGASFSTVGIHRSNSWKPSKTHRQVHKKYALIYFYAQHTVSKDSIIIIYFFDDIATQTIAYTLRMVFFDAVSTSFSTTVHGWGKTNSAFSSNFFLVNTDSRYTRTKKKIIINKNKNPE